MELNIKKYDLNIYINYLIVVLAFAIPVSYSLRDIILGIILVLWLAEGGFKKKYEKIKANINVALLAYFAVFILRFLSNFWSSSLHEGSYKAKFYFNSFDYVIRYDFFYLSIILVILSSFNVKYTKKVISSFILGMFVSEIVSYGIILGLWTTRVGTPHDPTPFLANHSIYSLFLSIAIFWVLDFAYKERNIWKKILYYIFSFTATMNLFFNAGRTGQFIYLFLVFVYAYYHYKNSLKKILSIIFFAFVIVILFYGTSKMFQKRIYMAKHDIVYMMKGHYNTPWGGRVLAWYVTRDLFFKHPVLGCGVGGVKKEMFEDVQKYGQRNALYFQNRLPHMHNQFLQIIAETGIVGGIFFAVFLFFVFKTKYRRDVAYYAAVFLTAYTIAFFTETFLMKNASFLLFNMFIAIFTLNRIKEGEA